MQRRKAIVSSQKINRLFESFATLRVKFGCVFAALEYCSLIFKKADITQPFRGAYPIPYFEIRIDHLVKNDISLGFFYDSISTGGD